MLNLRYIYVLPNRKDKSNPMKKDKNQNINNIIKH